MQPPGTLELVIGDGPWQEYGETPGLAVAADGSVFLDDQANVYVITGTDVDVALWFDSVALDPAGGFHVVEAGEEDGAPHLFHLSEASDQTKGLAEVIVTPSLAKAQAEDEVPAFQWCSIAVAPAGAVYL